MRLIFSLLILAHGLIHLMGFVKAFKYAEMSQLSQEISRRAGLLWLVCALLLTVSGILFLLRQAPWWWIALPALLLSQALIFGSWRNAKFGTVANLIILLPVIVAALDARSDSYGNRYKAEAREGLARCADMPLVMETDLSHLPDPVQKYLRVTGAVGRPQIHNFRAVFTGDFRNGMKSPWMPFRSEQFNFLDEPTRVFLMKASMYGLPVEGLHLFRGENATMQIKVASLIQVVDGRGPQMNRGETVTLFNDICVMAPSALIDRQRIQWQDAGPLAARARFTHAGNTISTLLSFNESGELIDFVSNDRFMSADGKTFTSYPWSTPLRSYKDFGGRKVAAYGEAVWHTPEGEFSYGKFNLVEIAYNLKELQ